MYGRDVAKATGQSTDLDREVVAAWQASYAVSPRLKKRDGGLFGVEEPAPRQAADATASRHSSAVGCGRFATEIVKPCETAANSSNGDAHTLVG